MFRFGDPGGRMYTSVGTSNARMLALWTIVNGPSKWTVSAGNGRTTGSCLRFTSGSGGFTEAAMKTLDAQQTWGLAFAIRIAGVPNALIQLCGLKDTTTYQVDIRLNTDMSLTVTRNGTILGTVSPGLSIGTWYHLELKVKIDPSVGTVDLRINGVSKLSLTGQNTRASSNSTANVIFIGPDGSGGSGGNPQNVNWDFDDIIIWDTQATDANGFSDIHDFIGDCGLAWSLPSGAGTTTQFTPDTGSNYARVNEATPDDDTSYVEDATVGHIDTYALTDLGANVATVKSVALVPYARKTDVGSRGMKTELRSAAANAAHATEIALTNTYQYYFQNWGQDPNNGSPQAWTPTIVNALEIGQQVSS